MGGGGWGPVATSGLLAEGRCATRLHLASMRVAACTLRVTASPTPDAHRLKPARSPRSQPRAQDRHRHRLPLRILCHRLRGPRLPPCARPLSRHRRGDARRPRDRSTCGRIARGAARPAPRPAHRAAQAGHARRCLHLPHQCARPPMILDSACWIMDEWCMGKCSRGVGSGTSRGCLCVRAAHSWHHAAPVQRQRHTATLDSQCLSLHYKSRVTAVQCISSNDHSIIQVP